MNMFHYPNVVCPPACARSIRKNAGSDSPSNMGNHPSLFQNNQSEGDFRCWRRKGRGAGCHFWHDAIVEVIITGAREMHATHRERIMQRWSVVQHELMPELAAQVGVLTPKLEKLIHTLEWVRIEEF